MAGEVDTHKHAILSPNTCGQCDQLSLFLLKVRKQLMQTTFYVIKLVFHSKHNLLNNS